MGPNQGLPKDKSVRRNYSAGSVTDEWDVDTPRTPVPRTSDVMGYFDDVGGMGIDGEVDFGPLGRPQKPPKL